MSRGAASGLAAAAFSLLLAGCAAEPRPSQADRLNASGADALAAGRPRTAAARFSAAAEASAARDDQAQLARDLHNRGLALLAAGRPRDAADDLAESLRLALAAGATADDRVLTRLALATALVADHAEDHARAILAEAEPVSGGLRARLLASRAALAMRAGGLDEAEALLAEGRPLARGDDAALGAVLVNQGHLARLRLDHAAARRLHAEAAATFRRAGGHAGLAAALEGEALAAEALGDRAAAARAWRRAAQVPHGGPTAREQRLAEAARLER